MCADAQQHASLGDVGSMAANNAAVGPQVGADFAGQPVVPPAIAGLALPQKHRHPHFELLGQPDDLLAALFDGFAERVGAGRGVANIRRPDRDAIGKPQGFRRIARHCRRRVVLLADRGGDAAEQRLEDFDDLGDALHRFETIRGVVLQRFDLLRDFFGSLLGLLRQLLHLRRDHGKAAAGFAGAGGFDGGVERQEIGLPGDGRDQIEHLADLRR